MPGLLIIWKVIGQSKQFSHDPTDDLNGIDKDPPQTHRVARPAVYFTDLAFKHSRSMTSIAATTNTNTTSNDGL
jgi:hypothetical protein